MNIKRAKEEIRDTVAAYLLKNEYGEYEIPVIRQRPILLLGAPGIGKTQIMEQVARECEISLVSYTITHHTRQSAIGLPYIAEKQYGETIRKVTEYTMSEIVAAIYEKIEKTGYAEGILFIDEINCVSETLAPAMLQFLQCKTFGSHAIPQGWVIAAAGNPPEYNRSVREFDVVTMDRIKKIEVEPDFSVWKEYAVREEIHPAILSYLETRRKNFYRMETTVDGRLFATPRGWEDLSRLLRVYEKLGKTVDKEVVVQYIQHPEIAGDFAAYLELYKKYQTDYQIDAILGGSIEDLLLKKIAHASFDERLSVLSLLMSRLNQAFLKTKRKEERVDFLYERLEGAREALGGAWVEDPIGWFGDTVEVSKLRFEKLQKAELLDRVSLHLYQEGQRQLEEWLIHLKKEGISEGNSCMELLNQWFEGENEELDRLYEESGEKLEHVFDFMEAAFGNGQEMVVFLTELNTGYYAVQFLKNYPCERYDQYNEQLLLRDRRSDILDRIERIR